MCKERGNLERLAGLSALSTQSLKAERLKVVALNERQVAATYGISASSLQKYRMNRVGPPYIKIGKRCMYLVEDLNDYFNKHRIDPSKPQ